MMEGLAPLKQFFSFKKKRKTDEPVAVVPAPPPPKEKEELDEDIGVGVEVPLPASPPPAAKRAKTKENNLELTPARVDVLMRWFDATINGNPEDAPKAMRPVCEMEPKRDWEWFQTTDVFRLLVHYELHNRRDKKKTEKPKKNAKK